MNWKSNDISHCNAFHASFLSWHESSPMHIAFGRWSVAKVKCVVSKCLCCALLHKYRTICQFSHWPLENFGFNLGYIDFGNIRADTHWICADVIFREGTNLICSIYFRIGFRIVAYLNRHPFNFTIMYSLIIYHTYSLTRNCLPQTSSTSYILSSLLSYVLPLICFLGWNRAPWAARGDRVPGRQGTLTVMCDL